VEDPINIICCGNFRKELEDVRTREPDLGLRLFFYEPQCSRPFSSSQDFWETFGEDAEKLEAGPTLVLGGHCLSRIAGDNTPAVRRLTTDSCIYLLIAPDRILPHLRQGNYIVTPGWLVNWESNLKELGFSREQARLFFHDTISAVLLLDTGLYPQIEKHLEAFAEYIDLPDHTVPTDTSRIGYLIYRELHLHEKEEDSLSSVAMYQMTFDLIHELAGLEKEVEIIDRFLDFCGMIFAAGGVIYLSKHEAENRTELHTWGTVGKESITAVRGFTGDYSLDLEKKGFTLNISYRSEGVGVISVLDTAFPENIEQYLNLGLSLTGSIAMAVNTAREKKKMNQLNRELEIAVERVNLANKAKNQFIANVSHELRTPIHGIIGMVDLFSTDELSENHRDLLRNIRTASSILKDLINDIIDISRIEAGKLIVENSAFRLPSLISDTYEILLPAAEERGISLVLEGLDTLPAWVEGDPKRIRQILFNLTSNGIKFTEKGSVTISASSAQTETGYRFTVSVEDTGIGIPKDKQHLLFQAFSQIDTSYTRSGAGSGLGLAITKELVDLLKGELFFTSTEGKGSRFTFTVPLGIPDTADRVEEPTPGDGRILPSVDVHTPVLIVDDNKINRLTIERALLKLGLPVVSAADGEEAVRFCENQQFSIIFMDCYMPLMDGFTATEKIRELGGWAESVPIIAVTASALPEDLEKCRQAGMDGHLEKPFNKNALMETLAGWLGSAPDRGDIPR
jgi:signal transduction histidine kinase/CheY-like chemotaxis protein